MPGEFRRLLHRERARTDRWGGQFSLLCFESNDRKTADASLRCLIRLARRRLRVTDDIGWMDRSRVGVLLPHTPASGAWIVADDLFLQFPPNTPLPTCAAYVYPSQPPPARNESDEERENRAPVGVAIPAQSMELLFAQPLPLWKRALDVSVAGLALVLLAPLLAAIAAAIKVFSPGPVLFAQWRRGLGGRPFRLYKFRSMVADAESRKRELMTLNEQDGPAFKITADPRVTAVGRWLRATSLDELPQLWNVLRGDMSLVGPRPLPLNEADGCEGWQRRRLDVTPGLTCTWQVNKRAKISFADWMRMDLRYLQSLSFWSDVKLLAATIPAVVFRRNK